MKNKSVIRLALVSLTALNIPSLAFVPISFRGNALTRATDTGKSSKLPLSNVSGKMEEGGTSDRRSWIKKALGGAALTGIVANKIAIEGPEPYQPPPGSLAGRVMVITGGNTGLGLESAKRLATGGATVVLTSRSIEKGTRAVQAVKDYVSQKGVANENVHAIPLDLCDLAGVRAFPDLLKRSPALADGTKNIDVLLNNAGVMAIPDKQITKDGFERTFQTNHLGHFALTALLMPFMNSDRARVVNVSSSAYMICSKGLDLDNLNAEKEYKPWDAYGRSKLENILFTKELQRRAKEAGKNIDAVSLHPGAVRTDLPRYLIGEEKYATMQSKPTLVDELVAWPLSYFTKGVERGATCQIWLSSGEGSNVGGKFFQNCEEQRLPSFATDMSKAKELWSMSELLSGVPFVV